MIFSVVFLNSGSHLFLWHGIKFLSPEDCLKVLKLLQLFVHYVKYVGLL